MTLSVPLSHELNEDLLSRLFPADNLRVARDIIDLSDVLKLHLAILGHIELVEGAMDDLLAGVTELASEGFQEFIEINLTVSITIEMIEHLLSLLLGKLEAEVHETPAEVIQVKLAVRVVVHSLKDLGETAETTGG